MQVMPYSTACSTTLSNFEAGQNYKDVDDPAVTVRTRSDVRAAAHCRVHGTSQLYAYCQKLVSPNHCQIPF